MGHEEFMSQEEVDALLKGVTGEVDTVADETRHHGVRPYNLATQERIVRGRMPGLEIINDRFARLLRVGIFNFMRRSAEISVGPVKVQKYSEFTRNLPIPTNLNLVHVKPRQRIRRRLSSRSRPGESDQREVDECLRSRAGAC